MPDSILTPPFPAELVDRLAAPAGEERWPLERADREEAIADWLERPRWRSPTSL